jgi:hypothetical protein
MIHILWYYLWIAPHVLQVVILYAMVRRGLQRQFPAFFLYTILEVLQTAVLFAVAQSRSNAYHSLYAVGLALSTAIRFWLIYELFVYFFHSYPTLSASGKLLFRAATMAFLLSAIGLAVVAPAGGTDPLLRPMFTVDRTVSILQCGLLIVLFLFSRYFSLSWRTDAFGIALGMGIFASVELATSAIWLHLAAFRAYGNTFVNLLTMGAYHCVVVIWLFYLLRTEPAMAATPRPLPKHDLEVWNQELERLLQP